MSIDDRAALATLLRLAQDGVIVDGRWMRPPETMEECAAASLWARTVYIPSLPDRQIEPSYSRPIIDLDPNFQRAATRYIDARAHGQEISNFWSGGGCLWLLLAPFLLFLLGIIFH